MKLMKNDVISMKNNYSIAQDQYICNFRVYMYETVRINKN